MSTDTPDYDTIAEQEIESLRDELEDRFNVTLDRFSRLLTWLDRGRPGKLPINGQEYTRRQAARKRRRRGR